MKNNLMKKWIAVAMVCLMTASMAACGNSEKAPAEENGNTTQEETQTTDTPAEDESLEEEPEADPEVEPDVDPETESAGDALSEEDYMAKIKELSEKIATESAPYATIDTTDLATAIPQVQEMGNALKPLYEELANLQAPEKYAEAQAKIKSGASASAELLEISLEILENGGDDAKVAELQEKYANLQTAANDLAAGASMLG